MNQEKSIMTAEEGNFKMMCLEEEASILCSVFPDAYLRVNFNATLRRIGGGKDGFYTGGNAVISLPDYQGRTLYHEFAHYLASVFPKDEFKQIASPCYKEMCGVGSPLKHYPKEARLTEGFCYYFEFTMSNPNKRNNAFIQKVKSVYMSVNPSEEYQKEKEEVYTHLRRVLGGKILASTHIFLHVGDRTYNDTISRFKSNPARADIVERSEKLNEGAL